MLTPDNQCYFLVIKDHCGVVKTDSTYYGYIVKFEDGSGFFEGVLAPNMRVMTGGGKEWILFPMANVQITKQPQTPVLNPAYEVDE